MNALLNINIRVNSAAANAQVRALQQNLGNLNQTLGNTSGINAFNRGVGSGLTNLDRFGKNLQWTGRQLEFNFTLPLVLAGAAATKFALDNERAMVGVRKVYGNLEDDAAQLNAELKALEKSFELLSSRFGVHQDEVIKIGAAWAQAGAAGVGLAKATRLTLEAMVLGEMEAIEATNGLIAVQSAYRLNTDQLRDAIAQLNIVENQTSIQLKGLIDVITRAGGAAATAGIDIRHLAAMAATLVPQAGSASQAGNALRTVISRIMSPTQDAAEVMASFGINILDASWQAKNGVQRIETLAAAFEKLTQGQKAQASTIIASRWQVNRLDILFRDITLSLDEATRKQSAYGKALDATADAARYNAIYARELSTVLASTPRGFSILTNVIRNSLATAIAPLIPALIGVLSRIAQLVTWFSKLDPGVQQLALAFLILLAAVGPVTRYLGSFVLLGTTVGKAALFIRSALFGMSGAQLAAASATQLANTSLLHQHGVLGILGVAIMKLVLGPFHLLSLAWAGLIAAAPYLLRAFTGTFTVIGGLLVRGFTVASSLGVSGMVAIVAAGLLRIQAIFAALPAILAQVWLAVWTVSKGLMTGFTLSFITATRTITIVWYGLNSVIATIWFGTVAALQRAWIAFQLFMARFPSVMALIWQGAVFATTAGLAAMRTAITGFTAFLTVVPKAIAFAFASPWVFLTAAVAIALIALRRQIAAGVRWIVDQFKQLIPALAAIVKRVFEILSYLNPFARHSPSLVDNVRRGVSTILDEYARLASVGSIIVDALDALESFSSATFGGSREAELAGYLKEKEDIVSVSPSAGPEVDRLISAIFRLKDALSLVGQELTEQRRIADDWEKSLNAAMKPMNDAIFENEMAQKRLRLEILKLEQAGVSVDKMRDKMAALAGEMEMLQSESTSLRLAGAGSDILGYYDTEIARMESELGALEGATSPVEDLEKQLKDLQIQGEILQLQRDLEFDPQIRALNEQKDKVQELEDAYRDINSQIGDMEGALRSASVAARELTEARKKKEEEPSWNEQLMAAAAAGDFEVPVGEAPPGLGREGGLPEIEQFNTELEAELQRALKDMGKIDMFAPFKDLWNSTWRWIKENVGPVISPVVEAVRGFLGGIDFGEGAGDFGAKVLSALGTAWQVAADIIKPIWDNILFPIFDQIGEMVGSAIEKIGRELDKWAPLWEPLAEAVGHVFNVIKDIITIFVAVVLKPAIAIIVGIFTTAWPVIRNVVEVVWNAITDVIRIALTIIRGVLTVFLGIINGEWSAIWDGMLTILRAIWDAIYLVISVPIKLIIAIVKGLVEGIVNFFQWLWKVLVGNSIIPDIVNGITDWFKKLWDAVEFIWKALWAAISWVWDNIAMPVFNAIKWVLENIIVPAFQWALDKIGPIFDKIGSGIKWVWENVIVKVFDSIKAGIDVLSGAFFWLKDKVVDPVWNGIKEIIKGAWNIIAGMIEAGINGFITAFNFLGRGINIITGVIKVGPHIDPIERVSIPRLAKGGIMEMGGPGGRVSTPTAVVGEGSRIFPEFVIPTDPRYRSNAMALLEELTPRLFAKGGVLSGPHTGDGLGDWFGRAVDFGKMVVGGGISAVKAFWDIVSKVPGMLRNLLEIPREVGGYALDQVIDWVKSLISSKKLGAEDLGDNPGWQKMWDVIRQQFPDAQLYSSVRPGAVTVSGNQSYHALGRAIDITPRTDIAEWIRQNFMGSTKELIYTPFGSRQIKNGADYVYGGDVAAGHWDHVHWAMKKGGILPYGMIPSLADGGIVMPRPGGILVRVGERGQREEIRPLNNRSSTTEYHFHGDLSFPNITSPDDASKFIRNLRTIAGG